MGNIEFKDQEVFERLWNLSNNTMLSLEERHKYERSLKAYRDYVNQLDYAKNEGRSEGERRLLTRQVLAKKKKGMSLAEIADTLETDIKLVEEILNDHK